MQEQRREWDAGMQACRRRRIRRKRQQRHPGATDSVEAAAAAPRGDGLGGSGSSAIVASSQGQGSLWWFDAPVARETFLGNVKCACSGHCYSSGHRYRGCSSFDLVVDLKLCLQCVCAVGGCRCPRLKGFLCSAHKRFSADGPLEFVLTRCAREALPWLMPCDITDFVNLYPRVRHDKAFVIIIVLLQEPQAIASFAQKALALAPGYCVDDLAAVLLETLDDIRSPTEAHRKQIQALSQQGAGRFAGVASTCLEWGLIECVPAKTRQGVLPRKRRRKMRAKGQQASPSPSRRAQEEAEEEEQWHLGLRSRTYRRTGAHERLGELLQASRFFRQPPEIVDSTTFMEMVSWAEEFDKFLGRHSSTWAGQVGYAHDRLRRKLVVGQLSSSSGRTNVQWSDVSVDCLKRLSPDVCDYLSRVPAKWSARDLSRFCTDRDDWGVFVSMFACLWGMVVNAKAYRGASRRVDQTGGVGRIPGRSPEPHPAIRRGGACAHLGEAVRPERC